MRALGPEVVDAVFETIESFLPVRDISHPLGCLRLSRSCLGVEGEGAMIFVGDDWAEARHDVWVMDESGSKLACRRLPEGIEGIAAFHELAAGHVTDPCDVVVGIGTDRGLWVHALVAAGYQVYAINPLSASRYRDRHRVSGAKADRTDAKMLSDLVRTDRHSHRQVAGDTPEAGAIQVVARHTSS